MRFKECISNDELKDTEIGIFRGEIIIVDSSDKVAEACSCLSVQKIIGFDTETRPSFLSGKTNSVSLLQLSTESTAYLFRLNQVALEKPILRILSSRKITKIGAAIHDDIKALQKLRHFIPQSFIDLQSIAGQYGIQDKSLRKLSAITLGFRISKAQRLSNWEAATLTPAQQCYAATDAWVSLEIYNKLMEQAAYSDNTEHAKNLLTALNRSAVATSAEVSCEPFIIDIDKSDKQ